MRDDDELAGRPRLRLSDLVEREVLLTSSKVHPDAVNHVRDVLVKAGVTRIIGLPHSDTVHLAAHVRHSQALILVAADRTLPTTGVFDGPGFAIVLLDEPHLSAVVGVAWRDGEQATDPVFSSVVDALRRESGHVSAGE